VQLNVRRGTGGYYSLIVHQTGKLAMIGRLQGATDYRVLQQFDLRQPIQPGQDYELELRVAGSTLTARLNGETLGSITDETFRDGQFGIAAYQRRDQAPALVKSFEFLDLDQPAAGSATATKGGR